jgi:photosystem II stability/assembly factor-like uncharacterized protein
VGLRTTGIFRTTDGGDSWSKQDIPGASPGVTSLQFLNPEEGWATLVEFPTGPGKHGDGMALRTTDGGLHWRPVKISGDKSFHWTIHFVDARNGWLRTEQVVYHTADGGASWVPVLRYPPFKLKID